MSSFENDKKTNDIEDFFNKNLYDSSIHPSEMLWVNIEKSLDEEESLKKRFIWFFLYGIILIIGITSLYFLFSNNFISNVANTKTEKNNIKETEKQVKETAVITNIKAKIEKKEKTDNSKTALQQKIQLGAFRKKSNISDFKKVPFEVKSEMMDDGITRYYVSSKNAIQDLKTIKEAGFKDAFIKKESIAENEVGLIKEKPNHLLTENHEGVKNKKEAPKPTTNISAVFKNKIQHAESIDVKPELALIEKNHQNSVKENNLYENKQVEPSQNEPEKINFKSIQENKRLFDTIDNINKKKAVSDISTDMIAAENNKKIIQDGIINDSTLENKKDSLKHVSKKDSVMVQLKKPEPKDSIKTNSLSRWAISLVGGPTIFLNQANTRLFDSKTEKQPITYAGEIKIEYNFFKNFTASIGIGYQSHTIQKDSTVFRFSKYTNDDYIVNSSFGKMSINNSILLQGYFMAAPIDTFSAAYKYRSTIQSLNIPFQINWYLINKSKFKLSSGIGINANYVFSQQNHLTLIKEHRTNDFYVKDIGVNRFNTILLLSLGCDIRLTKRLSFTFVPSYKYGLSNYTPISGIIFKPTYVSVMGGIKVRL